MLHSCHFDKTELKIMIFINFQVYHRNEKNFESSYGLGGRHLKIRDVCMDLEPCFKVHNLVVIQLKNTKLGQMTNLNMIFYIVVSICKVHGSNLQLAPVPCSILKWPMAIYIAIQEKKSIGFHERSHCS